MNINKLTCTARRLLAILPLLILSNAQANIEFSGNFQTGSPTATFTITQDITFDVTTSGAAAFLVFDEWVISDANGDGVDVAPTANLTFSLNGGSPDVRFAASIIDNAVSDMIDISANDGWLEFLSFDVTAGDTLTISSTTYTLTSNPGFNATIPSVFTGNLFITDTSGNQLATLTIVPEPSTYAAVLGIAVLGAVWLFKRKLK